MPSCTTEALLDAARAALNQWAVNVAPAIALAYSGGRDSTALLDALSRLRDEGFPPAQSLIAIHVHHGLHLEADAWAEHCRQQCDARRVVFELRRVTVERAGLGLEASARAARYQALSEVAVAHGARAVLMAHHLDDRIETFLLQWLRGAGVDGLAAFPNARELVPGVALLRPWAAIERKWIEQYCARHALKFIDDPSNTDITLTRNALRHHVMPALAAVQPDFHATTARSIELVAEAAQVLGELAQLDLAHCLAQSPAHALRLDRLRTLSPARQALVLRQWLAAQGVACPSRARLHELLAQALQARADARMQVDVGGVQIRRYRGLLMPHQPCDTRCEPVRMHWCGEPTLRVPSWGGRLSFIPSPTGFDAQWLRAQPLDIRPRRGAERLKLHSARPSKTLKTLFQEAAVPEYERTQLPLIWRGDQLIYVPRLGADARCEGEGGDRIRLLWDT